MSAHPDGPTDTIAPAVAKTLPGLFRERVARSPDAVAYREWDSASGQWCDFTWRDTARLVARHHAALANIGLASGDRVAIQLPNGIDWVAFDIAAMAAGLITVPLYTYDSVGNAAHILASSGARLVLTDTWERWGALDKLRSQFPAVQHVWVRETNAAGFAASPGPPEVISLASALPTTAKEPRAQPLDPRATATIIYTSGTTGLAKGVMLTHFAILWNCEAASKFIPPLRSDVFLSFLPLAHAFERTLGYYLPMMGGSMVAYARSVETLRGDLQAIRPTVFLAVPRIYERVHEAIQREAQQHPIKGALIRRTAEAGWRICEARRRRCRPPGLAWRLAWPLLDRLVARRVLGAFGGRLRVAVSGGASLPADIARFLMGMGLPLVEGYGLTEAAPVVTATALDDARPGCVGLPLHGLEIRLGDDNELLVRSPSTMKGYWQDPAATARAIDANGWLRTGDVAEIREGRVYIGGRLGERLALSTGEKVMASTIEAAIRQDALFEQVCVFGDGRPCLTAAISLNGQCWSSFASKFGLDARLPNSTNAVANILQRIGELLSDLPAYAQVRSVHLVLEPWTIQQGLLTPTLKVKRRAIEERYRKEIDLLYGDLQEARQRLDEPRNRSAHVKAPCSPLPEQPRAGDR
ncbi:MAG: long-chain fatty acid--CoA ligase [Hyphomicrobiaceae bacterium]|nr:MAG: long-chain fatty acid--CoA ligase [Hyphomicrobiaceae bacterium]